MVLNDRLKIVNHYFHGFVDGVGERKKLANLSSRALSIGASVINACVARVPAFTTIIFRGLRNVFAVGPPSNRKA